MTIIWNLNDPAVQASLIQSIGVVFAAIVAAICTAIIGKQIANRKRLEEKLQLAQEDIAFLLAIEDWHGTRHLEHGPRSFKKQARIDVRKSGLSWSGKFTPGRVRAAHPPR
ncbi:MAG: hypothetical protein OEL20_04680 [Sulfuritalea sp.]|nr:hypothetical protein [Sulfuritalea sp.]